MLHWTQQEKARPEAETRRSVLRCTVRTVASETKMMMVMMTAVLRDIKPENLVQSSLEAPLRPSTSTSLASSLPVNLVDFGNCLDADEPAAYADVDARGGFDVQTVTYRALQVTAGLLLCSKMDMWSIGCLLLECVLGKPLFTLPPLETSMRERADVMKVENANLLEQTEHVVTHRVLLDATYAPYQSAACYTEEAPEKCRRVGHDKQAETLQARLQAVDPGQHRFYDFVCSLLDVNPATRVDAKQAHSSFSSCKPSSRSELCLLDQKLIQLAQNVRSVFLLHLHKEWRSRSREHEVLEIIRTSALADRRYRRLLMLSTQPPHGLIVQESKSAMSDSPESESAMAEAPRGALIPYGLKMSYANCFCLYTFAKGAEGRFLADCCNVSNRERARAMMNKHCEVS
uniref:Protein kinase domain-containing protein n=1 Tax=Peronospora matthiolae TaxID=2874970 RepID=A0AAV1VEW9_9STRA